MTETQSFDFDDPEDLHAILASLAYSQENRENILRNEYLYENWKIDPELSDEYSLVAFNDNKKQLIHAIRGTDPKTKDVITDMYIVGNMFEQYSPYIGIISGLMPSFERILKPLKKEMAQEIIDIVIRDPSELVKHIKKNLPQEVYSTMRLQFAELGIVSDEDFGRVMAEQFAKKGPEFFSQKLPTASFFQKSLNKDIRERALRGAKFFGAIYGLGKLLQYAGTREPEGERLQREYDKHEKIKEKYADYSRSLSGHSLGGGISLHMSRTLGIPTYAFNPSPQLAHRDKPHSESKIVRTLLDPVSLISSTFKEPEKVKVVKSKYSFHPHSMDNFLPPKTPRRVSLKEPTIQRQIAFVEKPLNKCQENPELPECKSYYYI